MGKQVKVTSIDTLEAFRARLILFLGKAGGAVNEVGDEVKRTRIWLQQDQRLAWEGKVKRLRKQLEQAEAELFTSRLSAMTEHSAARQMAVTRLRRLVREAEEKLKLVKKWNRNFDSAVDPLAKKLEGIQFMLTSELPKAVTYLANAQKLLDAYTRVATPGAEAAEAKTLEEEGPGEAAPEAEEDSNGEMT
jgi:hypothetical protein